MKNKKVIKAITIGLAAMMGITSSPIEILANDGQENINSENQNQENTQQESTQNDSVSETAGSCADIINENNNQISNITEAINDASTEVGKITDNNEILTIQSELQEGANDIAKVGGDLEIAVEAFNQALTADLNVDKALDEKNENSSISNINTAKEQINNFNDANTTTTKDANDAIDQAKIANTSNSQTEAYAAKDEAVKELNNAEKGLKAAETAYDLADDAVKEAEKKYNTAVNEQEKAVKQLNEAKAKLNSANANATAANEMLKAAQAKMDKLNNEVTKLAQSKEDLEALKDQYYKLMVHFYRDTKINSAVYDAEGKLDIAASAAKAEANGKFENTSATENTMKIGRELMKDLVMYKLKANGAEDIKFAVQENGLTKKESADGELVTDTKGNDRVTIEETQNQYWDYPSGDDGRHHNVKVTYTITLEDGTKKEITEYYNYIYKAKKYNDDMDMTSGPVYLANIDPKEGTVERDTDANNMDDFIKLNDEINKAIEASKVIDEYNNAKKAVDDAQALVDTLNKTIDTLSKKNLEIDATRIKDLKDKLDEAKELLKTATENKKTLEDKVEEARKAVAAIDLSRFIMNDDDDDSDSDDGITITTPGDTIPSPMSSDTPIVIPITTSVPSSTSDTITTEVTAEEETSESGVAGVRVEPETNNNLPEKEDLVKLTDNDIPLAEIPNIVEDNYSILLWLLLALLLLLIAYIIYKLTKKKEKEESEQ